MPQIPLSLGGMFCLLVVLLLLLVCLFFSVGVDSYLFV